MALSDHSAPAPGGKGGGVSLIGGEAVAELIGLARPVVETGCTLVTSLLGEPCRVAGDLLTDQIYAWQWRNRIRIADRAARLLSERQVNPEVLPPGFLMPLLNAVGWVEEEALQELWARLLANAVTDEGVQRPIFIDVLKRMSGVEARLLAQVWTARRFDAQMPPPNDPILGEWRPDPDGPENVPGLHALTALGLLHVSGSVSYGTHPGKSWPIVRLTPFGWEFAMAVKMEDTGKVAARE